ncbi:GT4 family glycosyltransferase PelF [Pontibacillus sp. HMF3514]|uniref:GT4 family glycosyltransferase PelF n=1 Tax=Pontibacillus sp. HMF3514 TaxID=2692425 RepID=UPI00131F8FF1|nr:GT4 family glycosyltransferase PelF [Pontibacillus sp. HMF3514]QHE53635.1 DUF3492 domain-containing protein [Pontibacillus sp. HMF3514]
MARICLILEGSYPYKSGGVSTWVETLISNFPEHQFIIYAIEAEEKDSFECYIPDNVLYVESHFLNIKNLKNGSWGKGYRLTDQEKQAVQSLLTDEKTDWKVIFDLFKSRRIDSVVNFLMSRTFLDILKEVTLHYYDHYPFTDLYWMLRSMILPLLLTIKHPIPDADLYHSCSTGYAGVVGSLAKYRYNRPFIITEHGIYTREREEEIIKASWMPGYLKEFWIQHFYNMSNCAYSLADEVITLFEKNKEIQIEVGCAPSLLAIVPNGVDLERYQDIHKFNKEKQGLIIGAIVRVVPIKDIKTMLQGFAIVKRALPQSKFFIMGSIHEDTEYYEECLRLADSLELTDVHFTGKVDIHHYLKQIDILVLSSISEGQPLAILEGMASGIPFVTTDVGGCKELIEGPNDEIGHAGVVVPIMHYLKLADGIIELGKDPELREVMGRNGLKRVKAYYQKSHFLDEYRAIYERNGGS